MIVSNVFKSMEHIRFIACRPPAKFGSRGRHSNDTESNTRPDFRICARDESPQFRTPFFSAFRDVKSRRTGIFYEAIV